MMKHGMRLQWNLFSTSKYILRSGEECDTFEDYE